jgi:alkanesulfonate monooxygenase SsuD/methylene tetrahydromethanopterin reductase-like flavin-dependent oxidoreductase (luciferase family)
MEFGYFTLSDNHYPNNPRSANQLVLDIREQAILADKIGMHSAWVGEHHFDSLGVNSRPDLLLANIASQTKNIRLAPAVTVLPLHHPVHVAEMWSTLDLLSNGRVDFATGRGYDRKEYAPFGADFFASAEIFEEGIDVLLKAWNSPGKWSHKGKFYEFKDVEIRPRPAQKPLRPYVACFSRPSMELAAKNDWNVIYAPFAAAMVYGSLADAVRIYRETCETEFKRPMRRAMCSYFIHIASTPEEEQYGKQALVRYFQDALIAAFPSASGEKVPPTYKYFVDIVNILRDMRPEKLTDKSILCGSPQHIVDTLKTVEAAGIAEVILYFNYGQKPHRLVKEQMERFMREVAPHFA